MPDCLPCPDAPTLRTLFTYHDWANAKLFALARPLTDEALDEPVQMGPGSLRALLFHLLAAENIWYSRTMQPGLPVVDAATYRTVPEIFARLRTIGQQRDAWLAAAGPAEMAHVYTYTLASGRTMSTPMGHILLHVCNHGTHHRAQGLNMLRHRGVQVPLLDYIAWTRENPGLFLPDAADAAPDPRGRVAATN